MTNSTINKWMGLKPCDFSIVEEPNGDLALLCTREYAAEVRDIIDSNLHKDHDVLCELLDGYQANGLYYAVDPENVSVGLTSAPCITDVLDTDNYGKQTVQGKLWWFPDYQIKSYAEELADTGKTVFTLRR